MSDVVLKVPVRDDRESELFGAYLSRFMEGVAARAERLAHMADAPFLMVHSDPGPAGDTKVMTFQEVQAARDFSSGWSQVLRRAAADRAI